MAKVTLNSALQGIRGKIDNWVYRRFGDRMVIARRPEFRGEPTPGQIAVREKFRTAAAYARGALADPVTQALYQAAAKSRGVQTFSFVMGDFLNVPEVRSIDTSGYRGQVGDNLIVGAVDDFEVVSVDVVLRDAADVVLEEGPATLVGGRWTYVVTQVVAGGSSVTIEATAKDHAGNSGRLTLPPLTVP
ncbi:MAG TPA: hypothetical protein VGM64_03140 [Lacunisphaera sp.]|jgi:hypothetical protein